MTHEDKGNYTGKHDDHDIDPEVAQKLTDLSKNNCIPCASAHRVAASLNLSPARIGRQIDLAELQLTHCQVGLFGYPDTGKKFDTSYQISPALDKELDNTAENGRITCAQAWDLARTFKIKRLDIGSACEIKNIKIKKCQLGTF